MPVDDPPFETERVHAVDELADLANTGLQESPVRVLDLCCGAGGVGHALTQLPGLKFLGVDINDHSETYPGEFIQADIDGLTLEDLGLDRKVDLVWASPPCRAYTKLAHIHYDEPTDVYPTLDELDVRATAKRLGKEYVIENVPTCPDLENPTPVNGPAVGLDLLFRRHFETSFPLPDYTQPGDGDQLKFEQAGNKALAQAKEIPNWGKEAVRAAIPPRYVGFIIAHCPTLSDYSPPKASEAYAENLSPEDQTAITNYTDS
jgi:SAM-dependent methyltransferase